MPDFGGYVKRVFAEWTGQRERIAQLEEGSRVQSLTIAAQAKRIVRLMTELADTESEIRRQLKSAELLQAYALGLERRYVLAPPTGGLSVPEADITQYLPLALTTRSNTWATALPLAEWNRFRIWCEPRLHERPYVEDRWDCGQYTLAFLGLAVLWAENPACGWIDLVSPIKQTGHRMVWLLAMDGNDKILRYYDAIPRPIVPWPDGIFTDLQGWRVTAIGF